MGIFAVLKAFYYKGMGHSVKNALAYRVIWALLLPKMLILSFKVGPAFRNDLLLNVSLSLMQLQNLKKLSSFETRPSVFSLSDP